MKPTWICSSAVETCCIVEVVDVLEVDEDLVVFCCWELLFTWRIAKIPKCLSAWLVPPPTCLLLTTLPPPAPLPKGMQGFTEGSTRLPPTLMPDPWKQDHPICHNWCTRRRVNSTFRSEVDALLSFQLPFGRSLLSEPALLPATPLLTLRLPVLKVKVSFEETCGFRSRKAEWVSCKYLRYMLPSRLPTAYPSRFTEGSARPKGLFLTWQRGDLFTSWHFSFSSPWSPYSSCSDSPCWRKLPAVQFVPDTKENWRKWMFVIGKVGGEDCDKNEKDRTGFPTSLSSLWVRFILVAW